MSPPRPAVDPVIRLGFTTGGFDRRPIAELVHLIRVADESGFEMVVAPEARGRDAFVLLGLAAAVTRNVRLGTGIVNVYSRTAASLAMAITTLDDLSGGRAFLGLGVSSRAVIEEWHGQAMDRPLTRLKDVTEAIRTVRVAFRAPRERIPIYHATMAPAGIRQCARIADGWIPYLQTTGTLKDHIETINGELLAGGRDRGSFTVAAFLTAFVSEDLAAARAQVKRDIAFHVGAMGRLYQQVLARQGHGDIADRIQREWGARRRAAALDAVPDDLADDLTINGPLERCRERLRALEAIGVDVAVVALPEGATAEECERTLRALGELTRSAAEAPAIPPVRSSTA
jgi:alkanesulfonate monooxygenase SsuD/methylene tetrahydromethanopterin reductase-like flavin-dependent oxidoreductase (luciferase family)